MIFTTSCECCNGKALWARNFKDEAVQFCKNDWCVLFNQAHIIGSPLPKIIRIK